LSIKRPLPIVEFPQWDQILIPSTCDYQRFRYKVTVAHLDDVEKSLKLCELKYRQNQDPPIFVIDLPKLEEELEGKIDRYKFEIA
jgi:hypothetical protein